MPEHISSYAINQSIAKEKGLRKYGFHGLSCRSNPSYVLFAFAHGCSTDSFILRQVAKTLKKVTSSLPSGDAQCLREKSRTLRKSI